MSNRSSRKVDYLIRLGLVSDPDKLTWYHKIFASPTKAVKDFNLRPYVGEILESFIELIFSDDLIYNRIRTLLSRKKKRELPESLTDAALASLLEKAVDFDVPLEVLLDVYNRGFLEEGRNIDPDQNAFNRVNSFLQGGKALELDRDLLDEYYLVEEKKKAKKPYNPTLATINKIMKYSEANPDKDKKKPKKK